MGPNAAKALIKDHLAKTILSVKNVLDKSTTDEPTPHEIELLVDVVVDFVVETVVILKGVV
jgi:hypothetical protein